MLRYSREVAFSAAEVYAQAAEARGAWDARLESLVVDAVLRGEADESMQSRAAALGWGAVTPGRVVVGSTPPGATAPVLSRPAPAARHTGVELLVAVHGPRIICIGGSVTDPMAPATALDPHLGDGPARGRPGRARTCSPPAAAPGPRSPGTARHRPGRPRPAAGARRRPAGRAGAARRPARPRAADRRASCARWPRAPAAPCSTPPRPSSTAPRASRAPPAPLIVHPNTVRYRLAGITKTIGYDLTDAHDAQTVRTALAFHRLGPASRSDHATLTGIRASVLDLEETYRSGEQGSSPLRHEKVTVGRTGWST